MTQADIDQVAGMIRRAGLSTSRLQDVRNLYSPFFRWAKRRGLVRRDPMVDFEIPRSDHISTEHLPPETDQLCRYLQGAVEVVSDIAPVLTLDAATGMRRGELVTIQRDRLAHDDLKIYVFAPKTRREREVAVGQESMAMLAAHCELMDERAARAGVEIKPGAYVFSSRLDCSAPISPDHLTGQVPRSRRPRTPVGLTPGPRDRRVPSCGARRRRATGRDTDDARHRDPRGDLVTATVRRGLPHAVVGQLRSLCPPAKSREKKRDKRGGNRHTQAEGNRRGSTPWT